MWNILPGTGQSPTTNKQTNKNSPIQNVNDVKPKKPCSILSLGNIIQTHGSHQLFWYRYYGNLYFWTGWREQELIITHQWTIVICTWVPQHLEVNRARLSSSSSLTTHLLVDDTIQSPRLELWELASILPFHTTKFFWFYFLQNAGSHSVLTTPMVTVLIQALLIIIYIQYRFKIDLLSVDPCPCSPSFK